MTRQFAVEADAVAIVGMAGRFPGADDLTTFWDNLCAGVESVRVHSPEELRTAGIGERVLRDPRYVPASGHLDGIDMFDADLFRYLPREAELMDPQHRLFLEASWSAAEDADLDRNDADNVIGVFGGCGANTYFLRNLAAGLADTTGQLEPGTTGDYLTTRVAYKLGLTGPAVTVQTACSSALVAVCMACDALQDLRCDAALAGGVSVQLPSPGGYRYQPEGMLSSDGHCRAFDADADGSVFGSGVGVVVLKRLADARTAGDHVYAVIKGWAVNNDGGFRAGFEAPAIDGQAAVVAEALASAGVDPASVTYVEAHGSATRVGDPIEVAALTKAFHTTSPRAGVCALGSVKTNIGHLDAASGIAGLIKTALALRHRAIPPSLHFHRPNPEIDFTATPFRVATQLLPWDDSSGPRRASVSSFGLGGTNAHMVLEEAPPRDPSGPSRPVQVLTISAPTPDALQTATSSIVEDLRRDPNSALADLAFTLATTRRHLPSRQALICRDVAGAIAVASSADPRLAPAGIARTTGQVAFLLPGVGDQYTGMALQLYQGEPLFREQVDRCATLLRPVLGRDLRDLLYPGGSWQRTPAGATAADGHDSKPDLRRLLRRAEESPADRALDRTAAAQPATFVIEYALASLLMDWGLRPAAMIGHSIGEITAACLAGVFSLEDALSLVARRAQAVDALPGGGMLAVPLPENEALELARGRLSLAAVNTRTLSVLAGSSGDLTAVEADLNTRGAVGWRLPTSHPFHSSQLHAVADELGSLLESMELRPPRIPFVSNVTGAWITPDQATDSGYWVRHLTETVRFADGVQTLLREHRLLLEVGPGQTLCSFVDAVSRGHGSTARYVSSLPPRHAPGRADEWLLSAVAQLWTEGAEVDWPRFYRHERRHRVPVRPGLFARRRYWVEPAHRVDPNRALRAGTAQESPPSRASANGSEAPQPPRPVPPASGSEPRPQLATAYLPPRTPPERLLAELWADMLGFDRVGVLDDFFDLGGHSLLGLQMANRLWRSEGVELPLRALVAHPTVAGLATALEWGTEWPAQPGTTRPVLDTLAGSDPAERMKIIERYACERLACALNVAVAEVSPEREIEETRLRPALAELLRMFRHELGLPLYPNELLARPSARQLARLIEAELRPHPVTPSQRDLGAAAAPITNCAFILSSVRSGSTLLRVMLAGHPALFCPPELHLLPYADLAQRAELERSPDRDQGLQRAFSELGVIHPDRSVESLAELTARNADTAEVFARLAALAAPRMLVDKSPGNANHRDSLDRAESLFDRSRYVVLARHPYAVIESVIRNRFAQLMGAGETDTQDFGEFLWQRSYGNIADFVETIDDGRHHLVRYEDLVRAPLAEMERLCDFLGVGFSSEVLHPYRGRRMRDGLGDPNFLEHQAIDAELGERWRTVVLPRRLGRQARQLAEQLGYDMPREAHRTGRPGTTPLPRTHRATTRTAPIADGSSLVRLQPDGPGAPLFLVHPLDGSAFCYVELARALGPDRACYALEAPAPAAADATGASLEQLAAGYLADIRQLRPRGPYHLGGWSMGGLVAYEMARQLRRADEEVASLVVIDSPAPIADRHRPDDPDRADVLAMFVAFVGLRMGRSLAMPVDALHEQPPERQLDEVLRHLRRNELLSGDIDVQEIGRRVAVFANNLAAVHRYQPTSYPGRVTLFQAAERPGRGDPVRLVGGPLASDPRWTDEDGVYGWSRLASGGVERAEISGTHHTLLGPPHVLALAARLRTHLMLSPGG